MTWYIGNMQITFNVPDKFIKEKEITPHQLGSFLEQNLKDILFEWELSKSIEEAKQTPKSELLNL